MLKPVLPDTPDLQAAEELERTLLAADPAAGCPPVQALEHARRARRLSARLSRPLDEGRTAAWMCTHLLRLGLHAGVLNEAAAARPLLEAPQLLHSRREMLRALTLAASEMGNFEVALDAAHEMLRIATPASGDGSGLEATMTLAVCCERMGDSWQAVRLLTGALEKHDGAGPDVAALAATNGLCATCIGIMHRLLGTGDGDEAREVMALARRAGEQAQALAARVADPPYRVAVSANLAEVMLHQGEHEPAGVLIKAAHAQALALGLGAYAWRIEVTIASWLLATGHATEALLAIERLLTEMGPLAPHQTMLRARHVAYRACRELGRFEAALGYFEEVERTERRRAMAQLRAQSQLFVTRTEAQLALWQAEQAQQDAARHRERAAEFAATAERDPLTGLGNRRHFDRRCAEVLPAVEREARPIALALIDIDHFKAVNDLHGHASGDMVLQGLAQLLRENTRARDVLARHGGEEFVVLLPGMGLTHAAEVCERLRERVAAQSWPGRAGPDMRVTISVGLAAAPAYEVVDLLQRADEALYRAKRAGRNRLELAAA